MTIILQIIMALGLVLLGLITAGRMHALRQLDRRADEICGLVRDKGDATESVYLSGCWERSMLLLGRLGFRTASYRDQLYMALAPFVIALAWTLGGWRVAGLAAIAAIVGNALIIRWLEGRRARQFTQKLPAFLERVRRFVLIGNTLQQAFIQAARESDPLLKSYIDPILRRVSHGAPLADGLDLLARQLDTKEVYLLAAYTRTNMKFGGRVSENLENLIAQIASQDRLEREIAALTGETRASALILLCITIGLMAFIGLTNHSYIAFFFEDHTGRILLSVILVWPVIGLLVMKRIIELDL
jgi:tight adherence protein B